MDSFVFPPPCSRVGVVARTVQRDTVFSPTTPSRRRTPRMARSSLPNLSVSKPVPDNIFLMPPYTALQVNKGDKFNFVRYFVDDFSPSPYFEGLEGEGVRVAVLDTGGDVEHPALAARINFKLSKNYTLDNRGNPEDVSDGSGHGTHCAGVIGAEKRGAIMYGVAPKSELVIKKVLSNYGESNEHLQQVPKRIAQAVRDAADQECDVISMSLSLPQQAFRPFQSEMSEMYESVQYALSRGSTVVAAAGNNGVSPLNTIEPPGAYGGVITVASHDDRGMRSGFSSMGGELDFMGPGEVFSTWPTGLSHDLYRPLHGTSMATPLVAGLAGLLVEAGRRDDGMTTLSVDLVRDMAATGFRARNSYEVREMLRLLAERPYEHRRDDGYGRLVRAYQYVLGSVQ